ncbi:MAG: metallo-dependent phosphatase [Salinisphaeraceae bacterium]|jgi:hypothetical protein|nr:metallo-dependent phosphatase [Salinisphaeraceae bacterium]
MRLRVLSDLHLEFYESPEDAGIVNDIGCDAVVLAGDIHTGVQGIEWAARTFDQPVIYVLGNHEFYRQEAGLLMDNARACAEYLGVHLLENDEVRIDGRRFLGCTLWTDFSLGPEPPYVSAAIAQNRVADFRMIRYGGRTVTAGAMAHWYTDSRKWLESKLDENDPAIMVTHFVPSPRLIHPTFGRGDEKTPYFTSDLEYLMGDAVPLWIYGHNHYSDSKRLSTGQGETWALSNQMGYPDEDTGFRKDLCIET